MNKSINSMRPTSW